MPRIQTERPTAIQEKRERRREHVSDRYNKATFLRQPDLFPLLLFPIPPLSLFLAFRFFIGFPPLGLASSFFFSASFFCYCYWFSRPSVAREREREERAILLFVAVFFNGSQQHTDGLFCELSAGLKLAAYLWNVHARAALNAARDF